MIQSASQFLITDLVIAGILVIAVIAIVIEIVLRRLQHRFSPWLGRMS
jgi:taurine transport system permease protein